MGAILEILKKVKLEHVLIILIILLGITTSYYYSNFKESQEEYKRSESNFKEIINFKDDKLAELEFSSTTQLKDFIKTEEGLKEVIDSLGIKIKHLKTISYQQQTYVDTIKETVVDIITKDSIKPFYLVWEKNTDCLKTKGFLDYSQDSLKVGVLSSIFTNKNTIVGHMERPQKNWLTRNFGRLYTKVSVVSSCGDNETLFITRKPKK